MKAYKVIGIVQVCIGGEWSELPVIQTVRALSRDGAKQSVLDSVPGDFVRWNTPELVQATKEA